VGKNKFHLAVRGLLAAGWLLAGSAHALETNSTASVAELASQIETHLAEPRFHGALWGVKIVSLASGQTIFENHADRLMSPASNSKLYTGALALDRLGADYHIITPILATARPDAGGTVHGDLVIAGRGDPSWNARHAGTNFWDLFSPFVVALTNAGVRHVTGDLIGDNTFFHSPPNGASWTVDDLEDSDGAEISALTLADNFTQIRVIPGAHVGDACELAALDPLTGLQFDNQTVTFTNGASANIVSRRFRGEAVVHFLGGLPAGGEPEIVDLPVLRPAEWFVAALKEAMRQNGILIDGSTRSVVWPSPPPVANVKLGEVVSPPLRDLVRDFMKSSQNLETDLIFDHMGEMSRATNTPSWWTSEDCALAALEAFFTTNGLPAGDVHFDEGSGLSRNNLTTANATVALLQFMAKHRAAQDFIAALPVAGVDGTLRRRMKDTPAFQNVRAKTGTLRWANALSGYVTTAAGEPLVFSLMLNRYDSPPDRKRAEELDDIAVMLARFTGRTDVTLESRYASLGTLLVTQFISAPFPHPARAEGHKHHDEFFSAAEHYSNSTVAMFIPKHFRATGKVDFVIHFHGWNNTVAGTLEQFAVVEQFAASGKNAVLIVPEGPFKALDSFGGKLEDTNGFKIFMAETVEKLRASGLLAASERGLQPALTSVGQATRMRPEGRAPEVGNVILSGHSGGYHVMAAIVDHGGLSKNIREVWLFDALYGGTENFAAWQKREDGRLLDIYTDHGGTKGETENLMAFYRTNGVSYFAAEGTNAVPDNLRTNRLVFLHSDMTHNDVFARRNTFEKFLKTSCLQNQ
jgi:D-alanyl-D-alanine carboxypeptidase/D-alanyl-D-alanine-endopeptidase (penicillin-binding protein 4)